ncbi:MAG TPA: hypothetical protein VJ784_06715 [Pyrinomonadaceae bacterium]|nr:hypothetical protein [Pyrinomonadaceae bacterium]
MSNKKVILAILSVVAVTVVAVPFTGRTANSRSAVIRNPPTVVERATITQSEDVPQVVSLQVTPSGFEPRETIAQKGKFLILLQNRTGRRDLEFWLARENEGRIAKSEPQKRDWKAHVQLAPGTYIIGETNHPEWQSVIRVTN